MVAYYYYYYYYFCFAPVDRSIAILEDRQSGYIHTIYHTFKLCSSVVVVVPQGI